MINPTIPNGRLTINKRKYSFSEAAPNSPGVINTTPNQPEVRFINIEARTSKVVFFENNFTAYLDTIIIYNTLCRRK